MTSPMESPEILKTDERGRVRVPPERREALLDEFECSGMSGAKFARLAGIKYATFANWSQARRKRRRQQSPESGAGAGPVRLIEALVDGGDGGGLLVELPGGGRARVESPLQLRLACELLLMMAREGCRQC